MFPTIHPLQLLLTLLAGWINRWQIEAIEYLKEENRPLKERLGNRRIRFTDAERRRLARKAHALGRKALRQLQRQWSSRKQEHRLIRCCRTGFKTSSPLPQRSSIDMCSDFLRQRCCPLSVSLQALGTPYAFPFQPTLASQLLEGRSDVFAQLTPVQVCAHVLFEHVDVYPITRPVCSKNVRLTRLDRSAQVVERLAVDYSV